MKNFPGPCIAAIAGLVALAGLSGCSSTMPVKKQEYAVLKDSRTYEADFPTVWKAIEKTFAKHQVVSRSPKSVDAVEMKSLAERTLETDWIIGQSRDKYVEFKVNDSPRRKLLQVRFKYQVEAKRSLGGTDVRVKMSEEIERVKPNGQTAGWDSVSEIDTSRVNEILDQIAQAQLSAAP